jgi:hypothetical protein
MLQGTKLQPSFFGSPVLSGDMPYTYTRYSVPQITVGCIRWRFPEKTGEPFFS